MADTNTADTTVDDVDDVDTTVDTDVDTDIDTQPDTKPKDTPKETPEAKRARLTRELKQLDKKHPVEKKTEEPRTKSNDFDYGQLAFLTAKGIEADEEVDFVKTIVNNTGRDLKDVISDDYVQSKLKTMREDKAVKAAVPSGTKRTNQSAVDTVEYWIAKGELPTDTELRRKVVNARIEKETKKDVFTP